MSTSNLYELLPGYLRLFDDDEKIISFICNQGIQPELDAQLFVTRRLPDYFDLDNNLAWERLDWLGQLVGLGAIEGHYLGIGINPNWTIPQKVKLIKNIGDYWQQKGTAPGVRQAIELWLNWEKQQTKLNLRSPFKDLSGWWEYGTPYDYNQGKTFKQLKSWGGRDYTQDYQPDWKVLQTGADYWQYDLAWSEKTFIISPAPVIESEGSRMGARNILLDFDVTAEDWRALFPDYHTLALEIFPVLARQHPVIHFDLGGAIADIPRIPSDSSTGKLINFDVDGYHYEWQYPYPGVISPEPYEDTETIITSLEATGGFEYSYPWGGVERSQSGNITTTTTSPAINGLNYGDCYGGLIPVSTTTTSTISYDTVNFGFNYFQAYGGVWSEKGVFTNSSVVMELVAIASLSWQSPEQTFSTTSLITEIIPPVPTFPWTENPRIFTDTIVTTVIPEDIVSCNLGVTAKIETGVETVVEIIPGIPSDYLIEAIAGTTTATIIPGSPNLAGWEWGYGYTVNLVSFGDMVDSLDNGLSVDAIAPIDSLFAEELVINTPLDKSNTPAMPWAYLGIADRTEIVISPEGFALRTPYLFHWHVAYGGMYPYLGSPDMEIVSDRPVLTDYQICNVPANWTTKTIISYEEIILPPAALDLSIAEIYPMLPTVLNGNNWDLLIETTEGLICQKPTNIFLRDGADYLIQAIGGDRESLYLEFTLTGVDCLVSGLTLTLGNKVITAQNFAQPLDWSRQTTLSVRSSIALNYLIPA